MPLLHGTRPILGFRFGSFAYLTDCNRIPERRGRCSRARRRSSSTRCAIARIRRTSRVAEALEVVERLQAAADLLHPHLPRPAARGDEPVAAGRRRAGLRRAARSTIEAGCPQRGRNPFSRTTRGRRAGASPVLALGNFDGLHRGHIKIIERIRRGAAERGGTALVLTFDPHPPRILRPDKAPPLLMTMAQKLEALARAGVQGAAVVRFTRELSQWEPETFVRSVLVDWLRVAEVWVGADFLFGRDRSRQLLAAASARRAVRVPRREDRSDPLQGLRRLEHAHPPAGQRGPRRRGRRAARPSLRDRRHGRRGREARPGAGLPDRQPVDRERADAAARRLCDRADDRRQRAIRA